VGKIDNAIKPLVSDYLNKHNIEHIPFTSDLPSIYRNADVFVLPSLEEGSPLVTYLAFGAGLPCLVSPMGAGGVVTDGIEGMVIDSHDAEKWIKALQKMACDIGLRKKFSDNARNKANLYTWDKVGKQRLTALINAEKNK
jgi:glycosyltransferase involved in cell wall biosynthesis